MEVLIENVRSFCGTHSIPVRPLTLVVGENNSGKSTFLAVVSAVSQPLFPDSRPALDVPPFDLSSYDSIASYKGGRAGRSEAFSIGVTYPWRKEVHTTRAVYREVSGQPRLASFLLNRGDVELRVQHADGRLVAEVVSQGQVVHTVSEPMDAGLELTTQRVSTTVVQRVLAARRAQLEKGVESVLPILERLELIGTRRRVSQQPPGPSAALAPIRSKPLRTYDQTSDEFSPEGGHIPLVLARMFQQEDGSEPIHSALEAFGEDSGLLADLKVRTLGSKPTDPFQIMVEVAGPARNLADVGYGVSQALPLLVESVLAAPYRRLLVQQPEVHLHPRAQAALGTFFARLVATQRKNFIIETHSDFLIDRVRQEVAAKTLKPEDVYILFLERLGVETVVHRLNLDDVGNVLDAPPSYRRFLLEEEVRLVDRTPG